MVLLFKAFNPDPTIGRGGLLRTGLQGVLQKARKGRLVETLAFPCFWINGKVLGWWGVLPGGWWA